MIPPIKCYAKFSYDEKSGKTPKYSMMKIAGYYPELKALSGKNGRVNLYLMSKREGQSVDAPAMSLQAVKNGLNLTGLKDYYTNGEISGIAYGYPPQEPTFSAKGKANPLYSCRNDGYLFIFDFSEKKEGEALKPTSFEMVVIDGGKVLISAYAKMLQMGGFNEALTALREQANALI